jgi:putative FmdB family regulatory protein
MPTYEYICKACKYETEFVQSIKDAPIKTCPKCKKRKFERLVGGTNFLLKGEKWFKKSGNY